MPHTKLRALVYDKSCKDFYIVKEKEGLACCLKRPRRWFNVSTPYDKSNDVYMLPLEFMEVI